MHPALRITTVILVLAGAAFAAQQASSPASPVRRITLPLQFPATGNIDAVQTWRFGRIDRVEPIANDPDIFVSFRLADGSIVRARAPAVPLDTLARESDWLTSPDKAVTGRSDYIERMVAFDVDATGRLIAIASLEPINRNRNRLRSALGK